MCRDLEKLEAWKELGLIPITSGSVRERNGPCAYTSHFTSPQPSETGVVTPNLYPQNPKLRQVKWHPSVI